MHARYLLCSLTNISSSCSRNVQFVFRSDIMHNKNQLRHLRPPLTKNSEIHDWTFWIRITRRTSKYSWLYILWNYVWGYFSFFPNCCYRYIDRMWTSFQFKFCVNLFGIIWAYLNSKCMPLFLCLATNLDYYIYNITEQPVNVGQQISYAINVLTNLNKYSHRLSAIVPLNVPADVICVFVRRWPSKVWLRRRYSISHSMLINLHWPVERSINSINMQYIQILFLIWNRFHMHISVIQMWFCKTKKLWRQKISQRMCNPIWANACNVVHISCEIL